MSKENRIDTYDKFMEKYGDVQLSKMYIKRMLKEYGAPNEENFWAWRELCRFFTDEHENIVNLNLSLQDFAHPSAHRSGMISFTQNADKGKADLQLRIKPGKYLKRTYPTYSSDRIRLMAEKFNLNYCKLPELKFAHTADDIEWVYMNGHGFGSCMDKPLSEMKSHTHPVRLYGMSDNTCVAYLTPEDSPHHVISRTVINIKEHSYIRVYGDNSCMEELLDKEGYAQGDLDECQFPLIWENENKGELVTPYFDLCQHFDIENNTIVVREDGAYSAEGEFGIAYIYGDKGTAQCAQCENYFEEEDLTYIEVSEEDICEECLCNSYVAVERSTGSYYNIEYIHYDNSSLLQTQDGVHFLEQDAEDLELTYAEDIEEWVSIYDTVVLANGDVYLADNAVEFENEHYDTNEMREDYNKRLIPDDESTEVIVIDEYAYVLNEELENNPEKVWISLQSHNTFYFPDFDEDDEDEVEAWNEANEEEGYSFISFNELADYYDQAENGVFALAFLFKVFGSTCTVWERMINDAYKRLIMKRIKHKEELMGIGVDLAHQTELILKPLSVPLYQIWRPEALRSVAVRIES